MEVLTGEKTIVVVVVVVVVCLDFPAEFGQLESFLSSLGCIDPS